jgi:hypothetical protein
MTTPLVFAMPGNERLSAELADDLHYELGHLDTRQFPDGETYLRFADSPEKRSVAIACTLERQTRNSYRLSLPPRLRESLAVTMLTALGVLLSLRLPRMLVIRRLGERDESTRAPSN